MKHSFSDQIKAIQDTRERNQRIIDKGTQSGIEERLKYINDCLNDAGSSIAAFRLRVEEDERFEKEHQRAMEETKDANEYLRQEGFDPEEIGKQGQTFVRVLTRSLKMEMALRDLIENQNYETLKQAKEVLDEYKK